MYIAAPSSSYCSRALAATDATCSHEVAAQSQPMLLLSSSSSTITATLGYHPPLGDFTPTCSLILGDFHDFTKERTMMLKVFPDDDLRSTAHDRKKEHEKDIHMTPITMMPSILMLALPEHGNLFVLRADTSRVGIDVYGTKEE
ncbi:hypothetical protein B296_00054943 [Ensete ventricosum]|uniref:Uncharacterized protein n=1 Tax=Ensete ventricosum TaxID=4639 RepID=A0A426XE84_ENSVE|nr:hypothetical protein B296_00054943 [Ensete ventricosum]